MICAMYGINAGIHWGDMSGVILVTLDNWHLPGKGAHHWAVLLFALP